MSETPRQPGPPEDPATMPSPTAPTPPAGPPSPVAVPTAHQGGAQPRRSMWRDAVSTTGGTVAVVVAAASLGLIALLTAGFLVAAVARHVGDDRGRGPWAGDSRDMPMPDRMRPGQGQPDQGNPGQGPGQLPPGMQGRGTGDLPGLGMGAGRALHGEAVIPGNGATATRAVLFQRGEVTDVTPDKLTVKSTDGFSATYTIGTDSRERLKSKVSTLAKGDLVTVVATKADATTIRILKSGRTGTGTGTG